MEAIYDLDFEYYHRIYSTVHDMMADRGFIPEKKMMNKERYMSKMLGYVAQSETPFDFLDKISIVFKKENSDIGEKTLIYFFILDIKMKKVDIEVIYENMNKNNIKNLVLVIREKMTPKVSSIVKTISCQIFNEKELVINPVKHVIQPKYIALNDDEKEKLLKSYRTDVDHLPGIFLEKIISRWYDMKKGDVFKIIRKTGEITYRAVR